MMSSDVRLLHDRYGRSDWLITDQRSDRIDNLKSKLSQAIGGGVLRDRSTVCNT